MEPVRINIKNLEKILSIFNFLWAVLLLFSTFQFIRGTMVFLGHFSEIFWSIFLEFHWLFLLGLLSLVSSCLLFFNRRIGWMGSVIAAFSNSVLLIFITTLLFSISKEGAMTYLITIGLSIFHLMGFIFLLLKKVRASHVITPKYLWITIGLLVVFITDLLLSGLLV